MIKTFLIALFFCCSVHFVFSQSIDRQSIVSWSGAVETPVVQIAHSAGETFVTTLSGNNVLLTQGFQQPEPLLLINCQMAFQDSTLCQGQSVQISFFSSAPSDAPYAWSTGATTPTITVSPTANTTYTCTVTSGTQTCTSSIDISVTPQQSFYQDADGDGFGNPDAVVQDCILPVGFVSNANDCNDAQILAYNGATDICDNGIDEDCSGADSTCIVLGCTDSLACNYNSQANQNDGGCIYSSEFSTYFTLTRTNGEYIVQYGDVNGDDMEDFLTLDNARLVRVYVNSGSGFNGSNTLQLPAFGYAVGLKDFDNDGHLDLLSNSITGTNCLSNKIRVYWNSGTTSVFSATNFTELPLANGNYCVQSQDIDFNNDGNLDIIATSMSGPSRTYLNNGNRNFTVQSDFAWPRDLYNTHTLDFNGDGIQDYLAIVKDGWADGQYGTYFYRGNGNGTFQSVISNYISNPRPSTGFTLNVDPLQNNIEDVALYLAGQSPLTLRIGKWNGANNFNFTTLSIPVGYTAAGAFDFNFDNIQDIVLYSNTTSNSVRIMYGDGLGGFNYVASDVVNNAAYTFGKMDREGNSSVVYISGQNTNQIIIYKKGSGGFYYADNDGDGFGDPNSSVQSCNQPAGFVSNANDCNDAQNLAYNSATDICDNGIDEDCSGADSTCIVLGCTDPTAFNYNPNVNTDDGSCEAVLTCDVTAPTTTLCEGESVLLSVISAGGAGASSQLPANLQQGLVAYYPFNGNANDESGNGNDGVIGTQTLVENRFGEVNSAFQFHRDFNKINIANSILPSTPSSFSISMWLKPELMNTYMWANNVFGGDVICDRSSMSWDYKYRILYDQLPDNTDQIRFVMVSGNDETSFGNTFSRIVGMWTHLVISCDVLNQNIEMYLNGILISQYDGPILYPFESNSTTIGGNIYPGNPNGDESYLGSMDDLFIYNRALSSPEIQQLYTAQSYTWYTGATTPTITVSPTANTTYTCTVTSGTQTCTSSIDISVTPQQSFYQDADGDGFGNPDAVVQDCILPVGYVTDNTDCNDNNALVYAASTETCNGLDDDCDGLIDEGLTLGSVTAVPVTTALYPTCSGNAIKSANLNNGANSDLIAGNGMDLWYSLTAQYNTLRAGLSAAFGDNEIRLYSYNNGCFELLETEHEVYTTTTLGTGNQVLISDDLIPGQTYYVAVHNISGAMNNSAKMCFNHFVGSTCDHYYSNNTSVYNNVCTSFKAQFKGNATNYIFDVLSATQNNANLNITPWAYTTTTANSVVPRLGTIFPVNMSASAKVYTLQIPVIYAIPDAAGNYTSITANATTTCTVTLNAELPVALRSSDRCPNTKNTTSSISIDRTICGALRYEWEFTQQLPSVQPAVTVLGGLNTTVFFLNNVPGMGTGKTYNVRVRPIHTNGEVGSWGTVQCLKTGTAGMVLENHPGSAGAREWANSGTEEWANNYSPEQEERFTLYPNPTNTGRFILTPSNTSDEEVKDIQMMDITGKVVYQTQVVMNGNGVEIEFGNLACGVYVVMVGGERLRLVVQ